MMLAVVVKRENILLAIWLPLISLFVFLHNKHRPKILFLFVMLASMLTLLFAYQQLEVQHTMFSETGEYGEFPFSAKNMHILLPVFLKMYAQPNWYLGTGILVLGGIIVIFRRKSPFLLLPVLLLSYLLLYSSHVRSYYQLRIGDVTPFDMLRYSVNLMCLWALLGGLGVSAGIRCLTKWTEHGTMRLLFNRVGVSVLFLMATFSFITTCRMRDSLVEDEYFGRVKPARVAIDYATQYGLDSTYIVTLEPLVVQMYGPTTTRVVDLAVINDELIASLRSHGNRMIYVEQRSYRDSINAERYRSQLSSINKMVSTVLYTDEDLTLRRLD